MYIHIHTGEEWQSLMRLLAQDKVRRVQLSNIMPKLVEEVRQCADSLDDVHHVVRDMADIDACIQLDKRARRNSSSDSESDQGSSSGQDGPVQVKGILRIRRTKSKQQLDEEEEELGVLSHELSVVLEEAETDDTVLTESPQKGRSIESKELRRISSEKARMDTVDIQSIQEQGEDEEEEISEICEVEAVVDHCLDVGNHDEICEADATNCGEAQPEQKSASSNCVPSEDAQNHNDAQIKPSEGASNCCTHGEEEEGFHTPQGHGMDSPCMHAPNDIEEVTHSEDDEDEDGFETPETDKKDSPVCDTKAGGSQSTVCEVQADDCKITVPNMEKGSLESPEADKKDSPVCEVQADECKTSVPNKDMGSFESPETDKTLCAESESEDENNGTNILRGEDEDGSETSEIDENHCAEPESNGQHDGNNVVGGEDEDGSETSETDDEQLC
jgi:hypothetical protein